MRKYLYIASGGFLGAILRFTIKNMHVFQNKNHFPLSTLLINVAGSFLLALLLTVAFKLWQYDTSIRLGIGTGFLGAFTTFSTLCKETIGLLEKGYYEDALLYIALSLALGLFAVYFGIALAKKVNAKLKIKAYLDNEVK